MVLLSSVGLGGGGDAGWVVEICYAAGHLAGRGDMRDLK